MPAPAARGAAWLGGEPTGAELEREVTHNAGSAGRPDLSCPLLESLPGGRLTGRLEAKPFVDGKPRGARLKNGECRALSTAIAMDLPHPANLAA